MSNEKPLFTHDCPSCVYLGQHDAHDLYYCAKQVGGPTVIARYSSDGPDYCSGMPFAVEGAFGIPELFEAKQRAIAKGLIK